MVLVVRVGRRPVRWRGGEPGRRRGLRAGGLPAVEDAFVSTLEGAVRSSLSGPLVATDVPRLPDEGARLPLPPLPLPARGSAVSLERVGDAARAMLRWGGGTLEGDRLVVTFGGDARFVVAPPPPALGRGCAHVSRLGLGPHGRRRAR